MTSAKIIVVGAGVSGLSAARSLSELGCEVTVLEARERIGGRIYTDRDWIDFPVEMGAEFVHGEGRTTAALAKQLQLRSVCWQKTDESMVRLEDGRWLTMREARAVDREFDQIRSWDFKRPQLRSDGESFLEYLQRSGCSARQIQYVRRMFANACGEDPSVLDAEAALMDLDAYAGDDAKLLDGYDRIVDHLAEHIDVRLGQNVQHIHWGRGVEAVTAAETSYSADAAVVTIPVGVLNSNKVQFSPSLPAEKLHSLEKLAMGPVTKMIYCFDKPVADPKIMAIYSSRNPPMWWSPSFGRSETETKYQVWTAFFSGAWARELLNVLPEQAIADGLETLKTELGLRKLAPVKTRLMNWLDEPYTLGGYSVCLRGGFSSKALLAQPTPPLFWAGEATGATATVHEAFESGRRAADELASQLLEGTA